MSTAAIARNILIHEQIKAFGPLLFAARVPAVLLKGAALTLCFPEYSKTRIMEDIDILVRPADLPSVRNIFLSLGYKAAPEDPCAMVNPRLTASIDILDSLWYLDKAENKALFNDSLKFPVEGFAGALYRLKPEDFYIHVLAHGAIHHVRDDKKWRDDLSLIWDKWGKDIRWDEVEQKLKLYGFHKAARTYLSPELEDDSFYKRVLLAGDHPNKGHVIRFIFLPLRKKVIYILASMFPTGNFLMNRYNLKSGLSVLLYRFLRPLILLTNLASFCARFLFTRRNT